MMRRGILLLAWLLLAGPAWAGYTFDGTNDNISSANDAVSGLDTATISISCWVYVPVQPAAQQALYTGAITISAGNTRDFLGITAPASAGFKIVVSRTFATASGVWRDNNDISLNAWHQIGFDSDGNAANDPLVYIDGAAVATTEDVAPSGARSTGTDSIRFGENLAGNDDLNATVAECAQWNRRLSAAEWALLGVNKYTPSRIPSGLVWYFPFRANATAQVGTTGSMTVTGATIGTHPPVSSTSGGGVVMFP